MTFGEKIKKYRLEKGWSQEYLANLLGTSKQVLSRYESGQRSPKIETVTEYAKTLGLPVSYLVDNNVANINTEQSIPPTDYEYLLAARSKDGKQAVRKLTKKQYEIAKSVIESLELNDDENL